MVTGWLAINSPQVLTKLTAKSVVSTPSARTVLETAVKEDKSGSTGSPPTQTAVSLGVGVSDEVGVVLAVGVRVRTGVGVTDEVGGSLAVGVPVRVGVRLGVV